MNDFEEPTQGTTSLAGVWATEFSLQEVGKFLNPSNLTIQGKEAVQSFDEATMLPALDCIPSPAPYSMLYPELKKVEINANEIIMLSEGEGTKRIVHLKAAEFGNEETSLLGNSVGRWEDDTLVITSTGFSPHRSGNAPIGLPSSSEKRVIEWLRLADDGKSIEYRFELSDPIFISGSISGKAKWIFRPAAEFQPAACSTENARKFLR